MLSISGNGLLLNDTEEKISSWQCGTRTTFTSRGTAPFAVMTSWPSLSSLVPVTKYFFVLLLWKLTLLKMMV